MTHVLDGVRYYESVLDTVGRTPLVRVRALASGLPCTVLAKLEYFNPGGSVKDRIGLAMVEAAEREGRLGPGGTIVECTSGNTGMGLAMVAAVKGYRAVFCMPDKVSIEKVNLLKAFGAEVLLSPTAVEPESPESYYSVARRIERERPGAVLMNQYHNPSNPQAHYESTGPELWEQTAGKITCFVAGMGTGGTITGAARYLKEHNPQIRIVGADPVGSILRHYHETGQMTAAHTYKIEGVGEDFIPSVYDFSLIDRVLSCSDRNGLNMARRLAREEAIFVGGSGGMAMWVALEFAKTLGPDDLMVVLLPDTGERYLSKVHSDEWMRDNHLLDPTSASAGQVVETKSRRLPKLVSVASGTALRQALALIEQHEVSQIPVFQGNRVIGTLEESDILKVAMADRAAIEKPVDGLMKAPLQVVPAGEHLEHVTRLLAREPAVLVQRDGAIVGILTRFDMLQFIAGGGMTDSMVRTQAGFSTRAIHAGQEPDPTTGAVTIPIYQTSTYAQEALGKNKGYEYARTHNATRAALEKNLASLENGRHGLCFASGLAATTTLAHSLSAGDHVVAGDNLYGGTYRLFERVFKRLGLTFSYVSASDTAGFERAMQPATKLVFVETPTNPMMQLTDIAAVAEIAHRRGARLAVDNTFMTPFFQRPLDQGADVVFHSVTKYLNGHSDMIGGVLITSDDALAEQLRFLQNAAGAVPGPMDCWLALRGTKTLAVRMERHDANARELAGVLSSHPRVRAVFYPGLDSHPQHDLARRQSTGFGGMISFVPGDGSLEAGRRVFDRFQLFTRAESLGGVESLVCHPASMTHASVPRETRLAMGFADGLLRLSVGIEDVEDLRDDLSQALAGS